jgi:hypothetical protein
MSARKPLRRTAWSLFLGGLVLLPLLVGTGVLVSGQGDDVAPGRDATWQAGQTIALLRPLGPNSPSASSITCTATAPDMQPRRLAVSESITTAQTATISCDRPVKLVAGSARVAAQTARNPLIVLPIAMVIAGSFLFFPRFSLMLARMGVPFRRRSAE